MNLFSELRNVLLETFNVNIDYDAQFLPVDSPESFTRDL